MVARHGVGMAWRDVVCVICRWYTGTTYFAFWDVSFHPTNATAPRQTWHMYSLEWGAAPLPMIWPGPAQKGPDCTTSESCKETCPGFVECSTDGWFYCCADKQCAGQHACAGNKGLLDCACGPNATA
mmetsp:Transcript_56709/g.123257  ORF Transcript_56709/g.123257 Transcript_56709/m.123257 type:complete len:127 (-) Transcript_56709:663-1043(-)